MAKVTFAKESAAKTALMLNGGTLEGSTLSVTSDAVETPDLAKAPATTEAPSAEGEEIEQSYKPHTAKVAELLAHGYTLSDSAIEAAINADKSYGISSTFAKYFTPFASKVQAVAQPHVERATAKAAEVDEKQGLSLKAQAGLTIGSKYYSSALASPLGAKVHAFYTTTAKEAQHIHEEALRIKESRKASATGATGAEAGSGAVKEGEKPEGALPPVAAATSTAPVTSA